jgi:hypothetical protein
MGAGRQIHVTLVEADGTSWGSQLTLSSDWQDLVIPVQQLQITRGAQLPLGYPGRWGYWLAAAKGRGGAGDHARLEAVDQIQISFRPTERKSDADTWAHVASVSLWFD